MKHVKMEKRCQINLLMRDTLCASSNADTSTVLFLEGQKVNVCSGTAQFLFS